ncbi:MAG: arylsulfatase [Verrucomicrobiales bacterium]|nr:arylsulfatase [Verrucomicrobiales bacterium]|tara:strand:+ start:11375 stop:12763 length:1389 start_codon:yes stop_codon:yes gene_type:complete
MLRIIVLLVGLVLSVSVSAKKPNFVVIFCDDLGYGDLSCFGHATIKTPNLDAMAVHGQKWTSFYVAASVCTPSRAGLMTGRLPIRNGMCSDKRSVLFPDSAGGLPQTEITIARALKQLNYATAAVGKWHLGHLPHYLPTSHGFDSYFGIPYSNDMDRVRNGKNHYENAETEDIAAYNVPLLRDEKELERPCDQRDITRRYTEEAVKFIKTSQGGRKPYFLYLAHSLPHIPLFRHKDFHGHSSAGIYGDVIEEIDWSVGKVLEQVKQSDDQTYVVFTSDNGPWLTFKTHGGSAGLLREGKGSTWEGGMREPTVMWAHPKPLAKGIVHDMGSTLDLLPTLVSLAGGKVPSDRTYDGYDLTPVLHGTGPSPRKSMFFYHGEQLFAVRHGEHKAHWFTKERYLGQKQARTHNPPLLYHLGHDPSEKHNIAKDNDEIITRLAKIADEHKATVKPVENQLETRIPKQK